MTTLEEINTDQQLHDLRRQLWYIAFSLSSAIAWIDTVAKLVPGAALSSTERATAVERIKASGLSPECWLHKDQEGGSK